MVPLYYPAGVQPGDLWSLTLTSLWAGGVVYFKALQSNPYFTVQGRLALNYNGRKKVDDR